MFTFSPWAYADGVPVPIMLVTPPISWRDGPIIRRDTCTSLCLLPTMFIVPRIEIDQEKGACAFGEEWEKIREKAVKTKDTTLPVPPPREPTVFEISEAIQILKEDIVQIKQALSTNTPLPPNRQPREPQLEYTLKRQRLDFGHPSLNLDLTNLLHILFLTFA